jgi:hypoxanthine phosphoribosyltransferase
MTSRVIISQDQINARIQELAQEIALSYKDKQLLLICILKGSFMFTADLARALWQKGVTDIQIDFMGISSYNHNTESSKNPRITSDLNTDIRGRHVIIVEDIIDTGYSLDALFRFLSERSPASLKSIVLLSKPSRREVDFKVDYIGFEVDGWIEGYGLDTAELGRGRPEIIVKEEN